jgi:hypothetical protein
MTASQRAIFEEAAARWEQVITGDLPNATYNGQVVDDVLIGASGAVIDGPFGILGQAGPDRFRSGSFLPYHGFMEFDTADLASLEANGSLLAVILHEMGHVLGVGTIWGNLGLITGAGGSNPRFTGAQATAAYNQIFNRNETSVPVENQGGPGTRDGHWRESVLTHELMTGYIGPGLNIPLSRITIAALADMGYQVNLSAADPFTPSPGAALVSPDSSVQASATQAVQGRFAPISLAGLQGQLGLGDTLSNLVESRFSGSSELLGLESGLGSAAASRSREQSTGAEEATVDEEARAGAGNDRSGHRSAARVQRLRSVRTGEILLGLAAAPNDVLDPRLAVVEG